MLDALEHLPNPVDALKHVPKPSQSGRYRDYHRSGLHEPLVESRRSRITTSPDLRSSFREVARQACFRIRAEPYFSHWTCPAKLAQHCVESIFSLEAQAARNSSTLSQYGAALVVTRRTRGLVTHAFSDFADDRWRWGVSSPLKSIAAVVLSAGYHTKYRSLRLGGP